jgi:TRAP transporter TAXI family solute receptor
MRRESEEEGEGVMKERGQRFLAAFGALAFLLLAAPTGAAAQDALRERIDTLRAQANAGTVGIISGGVDGTYIRIATDLASVLDDGNRLRILPLIGKGSLQNISDILFLRGIDIGIVQSDALAYARRERLYPGVEKSIQYITKLYDEELHILAGRGIARVEDLAGKKINIDLKGSGTAMTASLILESLGIAAEATHDDQALALEKLRRGDIAALAYVAGKPARLFKDLRAEDGLRFVPVPMTEALAQTYLPSSLASRDYPGIIAEGSEVETVAVGAVMAVYAWTPDQERYRKVTHFVQTFFTKFDDFLRPPRHAKWKEVNLAAQVPGWVRFPAAEAWLRREAVAEGSTSPLRRDFEAFLTSAGSGGGDVTPAVKATFEEFLRWQSTGGRR